ncbi:DUF551 domain-containing protein [Enterobacter hormaechei]|uniref:DUF551 domain-containing protein n=1 Tax=Enterobacter hormaechei TaxID=158836 RepID=UPI00210C5A7A|nr:DUF551 domain-containing protein [Enterobacter hormaechei]
MKIIKQEVQAVADLKAGYTLGHADVAILKELARIALASLEAEPVAWILSGGGAKNHVSFDSGNAYADPLREVTPLYTAPPAPVSVPDEDLLHMAASAIDDLLSNKDRSGAGVWADIPAKLRRAAMLQGVDRPQNEPQNIPENIPATQFKPVADLYGLTSPTGGETSFTFDAVEARDFIDGGWSCQEYVELGRFQEAMLQNGNSPAQSDCCPEQNYIAPAQDGDSPVIPDGWVACSEQMPEDEQEVIVQNKMGYRYVSYFDEHSGLFFDMRGGNQMNCIEHIFVTHWMTLPAAPQQEVK